MKIRVSMFASIFLVSALAAATAASAGTPARRPRRQADDLRLLDREAGKTALPTRGAQAGILTVSGTALPDALTWLAGDENASGSWGSTFEFPDTATVVDVLGRAQPKGAGFSTGTGWLTGHDPADNDEMSRRMLALSHVTALSLDADADKLLASRNLASTDPGAPNYPEGGWGLADGYETDSLTTALALLALETAGRKAGIGVENEALAGGATNVHTWEISSDAVKARIVITVGGSTVRLRMRQGSPPTGADPYFSLPAGGPYLIVFPDSGLAFTPGTNYISVESPNPPATAATYSFTASYETPTFDTRSFAEALDYLRQAQNPDGGWGIQIGDSTTLYTTEHVILALERWNDYGFDAELAAAVGYLQTEQLSDGSFGAGAGGLGYLTALAAIDLIEYEVCPFSATTENAISALLDMQALNGSWSDEPYDTGLALRALWEYDSDGDGVFADGDCSGVAGDNPCSPGMTTGCDDVCVDYYDPNQGPVVFGQDVTTPDVNTIAWPNPADVAWVKGHLSDVSTYGVTSGGALSWATFLSTYGDVPAPDTGYYYLFRLAGNCTETSWQDSIGAEPGRDAAPLGEITVTITSPSDGDVLTASPASVSGTVTGSEPVNVTVNGVAAMESSGSFTASVPLSRGANMLNAVGVDAAGFMGSDQISVTLVDYSIPTGGMATGTRIFTADSSTLDQVAYYTESQIGVPAGVTYTTTSVSRISATEMQIGFRIDVAGGATPGIYFFQVEYGLLDSGLNPLGPLTGNVFDFEIQITP